MTCQLCKTELCAEQDYLAICAECSGPIGYCCERTGDAKRCDWCKDWHCASHLTKTDCGLLCSECRVEARDPKVAA